MSTISSLIPSGDRLLRGLGRQSEESGAAPIARYCISGLIATPCRCEARDSPALGGCSSNASGESKALVVSRARLVRAATYARSASADGENFDPAAKLVAYLAKSYEPLDATRFACSAEMSIAISAIPRIATGCSLPGFAPALRIDARSPNLTRESPSAI